MGKQIIAFGIAPILVFLLSGCPPPKAPVAAFTAIPNWGEAALPVHFNDMSLPGSSNVTAWEWDFGDGTTDTAQNPDHIYTAPGLYTVTLTVTSQEGTHTHIATDYISVSENDILAWNSIALQSIAAVKWMPPQAARGLAMVHGAIYDAVNAVEKKGEAFHTDLTVSGNVYKEAAAAQAAYSVLLSLFPSQSTVLDAQLAESLGSIPDGEGKDAGISLGQTVADAIVQWRSNDGSQMSMPMDPFLGGTNPGQWRPTPPDNTPGMFYHWSMVTPFAMTSANQFRPGPPPALNSAVYAADFNETKLLGSKVSASRTMDQSMMATFWVGMAGTMGEAGRMNLVAQQAAIAHHNTLYENARLFTLMNVAMADAAIAGIDCKYAYVFWRPITAIREAGSDGNDATEADATWESYIGTPAHPEYISTHSALTKSAAVVLASFFNGDTENLVLPSFMDTAMTRQYVSFSQVAEEAGLSRIYGGIHFRFSFNAGSLLGQQIGEYVWNQMLRPISV